MKSKFASFIHYIRSALKVSTLVTAYLTNFIDTQLSRYLGLLFHPFTIGFTVGKIVY